MLDTPKEVITLARAIDLLEILDPAITPDKGRFPNQVMEVNQLFVYAVVHSYADLQEFCEKLCLLLKYRWDVHYGRQLKPFTHSVDFAKMSSAEQEKLLQQEADQLTRELQKQKEQLLEAFAAAQKE